jgi:hypothetical protein
MGENQTKRGYEEGLCGTYERDEKACKIIIYKAEQMTELRSLDLSMWENTIKVDMREVHVIMSSLLALMKQRLVTSPLASLKT